MIIIIFQKEVINWLSRKTLAECAIMGSVLYVLLVMVCVNSTN